ncbi:MAG: hypothetical protein K2J75_06265 [Clostridia bacterium]|nr:hypothetical protein [Clostridia bacterium]
MKKTKFITVLLLLAVLASVLLVAFVACEPKPDVNDDTQKSGDSGEIPPEEDPWEWDPIIDPIKPEIPSYTAKEMLTKIIESVEVPEQALNIDINAKVDTEDQVTTVNLKGNFYNEVRNELCFAVYQQQKGEADSQRQLVFAIYIVNDKIYIDMADGTPLIYLSDFDFNYLVQIIEGAGGKLSDSMGSLDKYMGMIDLVFSFLFDPPEVTVNEDNSQSLAMELKLKGLLNSAGSLIGLLPFNIPVDLKPLLDYLSNLIPDHTLYINAKFDSDSNLETVGVSGVDKTANNKDVFDLSVTIDIRDEAETDIGLPGDLADRTISEFSFTNLQFSIDFIVDSVKDESGHNKNFDLGKMLNSFLGTSTTIRIPEGLLLLNGGTGVRLTFKLDLDLNYDKLPQDNNKVAIELYLINPDGTLIDKNFKPQMGIYYKEGSFYLNTDNMLPQYLNGLNIKLDASLNDLVSKLVDLITAVIDKEFGLDFAKLRKNEIQVNDNGSLTPSSMSAVQKVMASSNATVLALSTESDGSYKLSAGIGSFVDMLASLLGLGGQIKDGVVVVEPNIYTDDTSIKVVVNDNFFNVLSGLIPQLKGVSLPKEIGDIVLSVNTSQVGLDSVTVETVLNNTSQVPGPNNSTVTITDPAFAIRLGLGDFVIGLKDDTFSDYIDSRVDVENTDYLSSLNGVIEHMLGGIRFSSGFSLDFAAGTYDLAPFIAGFGVSEVESSQILWTFDNDFTLDASLNLQIALNSTDKARSMIVLEMKTESGIKVGDHQIIEKDQVLLGIYGYNNNIYIDISNFNIAGIVLPKLSFSLNFTDLIYTLLDNVVSDLLKNINVQGGDLKFELDFKELLGLTSSVVAQAGETQNSTSRLATYAQTQEIDPTAAIIFAFNADKFVPSISLAAILAVLSATNTDIGNTLAEALSLMELDLSIELGRNDGFIFSFSGEFIPKLDENGESVYYFDDKGNPIAKEEGKIYRNIKDKPTSSENVNPNVVYYTTKKYNYGSDMKLVFSAGTPDHRVIVGNLGEHKYPIEQKAQEFVDYKSDLIEAIVNTVGKASVQLDIDLHTLDNEMNVTRLINSILANVGKKLELPIYLDLDDWNTHVQLALAWDLDLNRSSNSKIMLELRYEQKVIMGVYIHRNSIIVDLTGLGLFSGEIVNSTIVSKVFTMIDGVIKNIGNLDLNDIINDLLKNNGLPTVGTKPEDTDKLALGEEVAADGSVATLGEGLEVKDFIKYLTQAIHLENTAIVIDFTSSIINGMLNDLVGINLGLNLGLDGVFDLFGDSFDMGFTVEDITMDLSLSLSLGKEVVIPINFDDVPDWDATSGERFVTTLLNNLDIGFTIDLANYTGDTVNLENSNSGDSVTDNNRMYTRIIIEKVTTSSGKRLTGVQGTPVAPQGTFVVTLAHINKAMYDDNQSASASATPLVYVVLDHRRTSGQLMLALTSHILSFAGFNIGNLVGTQYINLDIVGMLGPVIDNLFSSIDGALDGMNNQTVAAMALDDGISAQEEEPTGLNKVFAELDIIKLLGEKGIMINLRANGTFNVTINFDTYLINKLIDDILSHVFAKNTGHASIVDLSVMAPDMFDKDYLGMVTWTRETFGAQGKSNTFWGDFREIIVPLLQSLLKGLGESAAAGALGVVDWMLGDIFYQVRQILSGLLPFAVWNTATLEVNVVDATISNIHFIGEDTDEDIYYDNDPSKGVAYSKDKDARVKGYFTEIFIYNSSKSVGGSTADGTNNGIVTWADIPTSITFMPYIYTTVKDGVDELIEAHFKNKVAIYQKGTTIMRSNVKFKIVNANGSEEDVGPENLFARLSVAGHFQIKAIANFSGGITSTLMIDVESRDTGGGLDYVEDIEMHAYDDTLPDFLTIYTKDGKSRKINTEYLSVSNWRPTDYKAHDVQATVAFKNGTTLPMTIHYLDSTVTKIIIDGTEGVNVNIDLYQFDINTSKIDDFTPSTLYFKYPDGKAVGLDVLSGWETSAATANLFGRPIDVDGKYSSDVSGGRFTISTRIAAFDGSAPQTVELTFVVRTKNVYSLTINDAINTINIDPYKYYMYMIGESDENPFPSVVEANYFEEYANPNYNPDIAESESNSKIIRDEYDEDVNVVWKNLENVVFDWNNNNDTVNKVDVALDNGAYPNGSFTWTFKKTEVAVMRNEVEAIYFDEALTQSALFIDPFQYLINGKGINNFPDHAYVQFTNGAVYYMPIAWKGLDDFNINPDRPAQFIQFDVVIGFDPNVYKSTGQIVDYSGINGTLLQEKYVNVQVEDRVPVGIEVDGSALIGGTYYIDPVQVLYYGANPFPENVTVRYMSGKTSVLEVSDSHWDRNFAITLKGRKNLKATLALNDKYSFDIDVEIIDRSNLKSELTDMSMDPYVYTIDERGNRVYNVYADNINLYQYVGTFDLETFAVLGRKQFSGDISEASKTFLKYVLKYESKGEQETKTETDIDYIKDFIANNKDTITIISTEVWEYFNVPVVWDLNEINYSIADTYTVKTIVQAADPAFNKEYKVNVEVRAKKVDKISGDVQYIMVGGTNLSETAKLTQKLTMTKTVVFDDGTSGVYEVTLDLTKIQYSNAISATLRWSRDSAGNMIITELRTNTEIRSDEVADYAMDIEVTVCSGDIAQTCTMKVHVLDNQMG